MSAQKTPAEKKNIRDLLDEKDAFLTTSEKIYEYVLRHTRGLAIGAAAVVLLVIGGALYYNAQGQAEQEAGLAFETALETAAGSPDDPEAAIRALEKVRTDYAGRKAARLAEFTLLGLYAPQGRTDLALPLAENLLHTLKSHEVSLKPMLLNVLGGLYETKADYLKAAKSYETLLGLPKLEPALRQETLMALGRTNAAAGLKDEAIKNYEAVLTEVPQSFLAYRANVKLAELKGQPVAFPTAPSWPGAAGASGGVKPADQVPPVDASQTTAGEASPAGSAQ